jgi:hypothetical protein
MNVQEKTSRALDLWLLDIALTAVSFFLAYEVRASIDLSGHTVMPWRVYLPTLWIVVPLWAIVLPLFGVYSQSTTGGPDLVWRLSKAIAVAGLTAGVADFIVNRMQLFPNYGSSRLILFFTFATNEFLLVSYRLLLIRRDRYRAASST